VASDCAAAAQCLPITASPSTSVRSAPPSGRYVYKLGTMLGIEPVELLRMINGKVVPTKAVWGGQAVLFHSFSTIAHQPCSSVVASGNFVCSRAPSTMPFINAERMWRSS
jgi:hypothetical protein